MLYPEQQRSNNANLCFNWFEPGDIKRDAGEALSIRQMIGHLVQSQGIDPKRIFVTGLSAGGAMANVMLSTYPEIFAGGAIISGLPYGVAGTVAEAFERMQPRLQSKLESICMQSWGRKMPYFTDNNLTLNTIGGPNTGFRPGQLT